MKTVVNGNHVLLTEIVGSRYGEMNLTLDPQQSYSRI